MSILTAPASALADGVVELRLPSPDAGDVEAINGYIEDEQLDGGWLPDIPLVSAQRVVTDWLDGWAGRHSHNGPAFVVTVPEEPRFIGVVGVAEHDDGAIEMFYGTAPGWRGEELPAAPRDWPPTGWPGSQACIPWKRGSARTRGPVNESRSMLALF